MKFLAGSSRRAWFVVAAITLSVVTIGCGEVMPPQRFAAATPEMRPELFFQGETRSAGVLETAGGAPSERFTVQGRGYRLADGDFRLDQTVAFAGKPVRKRQWVLRRVDEHRYRATLSDASGPVAAEAYGDLFHLTYPLKGLPAGQMEQWLYLQADGCTVVNEAVVRIAGFAVRRLSERISNTGDACAHTTG